METNTSTADQNMLNALSNTDPLNEDLSQVDPSFPIFAAGQLLEWRVTDSVVKTPEDAAKAKRWSVTVESTSDASAVDGSVLKAGTKVFLSAQLAPTGKSTVEIVKKGVAGLLQMLAGGPENCKGLTIAGCETWAGTMNGKTFRAKTKIRPESSKDGKTYPAQNELVGVR